MAVNETLLKTCEYIAIMTKVSGVENLESRIAKRILNGEASDEQAEFIEQVFQDGEFSRMNYVSELITPVSDKEYTFAFNNPSEYFPSETPMDDRSIYDGNPCWIYIHSTVQGRYGETYWFSKDCSRHLQSLPVIKAFKDYDFQVGHFYKLKCVDEVTWGNNKKKYYFEIEECSEEEYMEMGFKADAWNSGCYDKHYMDNLVMYYSKNSK